MNDEFGPNFVTLTDDEGNDIEPSSPWSKRTARTRKTKRNTVS